jgi:stringent starvation protein B
MSDPTPTKPYLLRALYEWCVDNGYTPSVSVGVDDTTSVPREHVRDGEIVLNIGPLATSRLKLGNEAIEFSARFGGVAREVYIPVSRVAAIYARENGQGLSFELEDGQPETTREGRPASQSDDIAGGPVEPSDPPTRPKPGRPALRRIK